MERKPQPDNLFQTVLEAWQTGRPVVPLFGAGISACASIPFGQHIVDYLLRVSLLSKQEGWHNCADYLLAHGWPNGNEVNAKLFTIYRARPGSLPEADRQRPSEPAGAQARDADSRWLLSPLARALEQARLESREAVALASLSWLHPATRKTIEHLFQQQRGRRGSNGIGMHGDGSGVASELSLDGAGRPSSDFPELEWLPLIHHVTGGRDHLVEAFFDGLVRNRRPGNAHRFIACLAQRVGWRLILTTNFDDLIETALREEGLSPVVYELVRGGTLPDKDLVRRHLSVIKLHGGAFGLRTGFELHQQMDAESLHMFQAYVPADALLLAVGQGGNEQRITSLIEALIDPPHGDRRNVLWVHYDLADQRKKEAAESRRYKPRIARATYGDASLLFHELHQRLDLCHPVGREAYHAFYHLPERFPDPGSSVHPEDAARPTREEMRQRYEDAKAEPVIRLWFNLYQFTSLAAFISVLIEELQRNDRSLPPLVLSPVVGFSDLRRAYAVHREGKKAEFSAELEVRAQAFCWHIARALQRQRYLIAIDAVNGFANPQSSLNMGVDESHSQKVASSLRRELYEFLQLLQRSSDPSYQLGQSVIYVSPDAADDAVGPLAPKPGQSLVVPRQEAPAIVFVSPVAKEADAGGKKEDTRLALTPADSLRGQLLRVAISFRKPRSLSALVRLTAAQWKKRQPRSSHQLEPHGPGATAKENQSDHFTALDIQAAISALEQDGILERQDGGLYSMNAAERDQLFEAFRLLESKAALDLQYQIAMYYRGELYQQSRDTAAYLEYVLHRLACIETSPPASVESETSTDGWRKLFGSLERERDHVLGRGHAASLLDALWCVESKLDKVKVSQRSQRRKKDVFLLQLGKLRLDIRESVTDIAYCLAAHGKLARELMLALQPLAPGFRPQSWPSQEHSAAQGWQPLLLALRDDFVSFQQAFQEQLGRSFPLRPEAPSDSTESAEEGPRFELPAIDPTAEQTQVVRQLPLVCDLIEAVCCIAEGMGRWFVVHQPSPLPRQLLESALALAKTLGRPSLVELGLDADRRASLECRCYEGRMDIMLRQHNPFREGSSGQRSCWWLDPDFDTWFDTARDLLIEHGQRGQGMTQRFAWLRCLKARRAYLCGRFEQAKLELNKAHAFAQRASDPGGATLMGIYHLHRAEHCTLWARQLSSDRQDAQSEEHDAALGQRSLRSLLEEALTALRQAEQDLGRGRREVFWTVRLFILRARAYAALLSTCSKEESNERDVLQWLESALNALYGAWINTHENEQRTRLLQEVWGELADICSHTPSLQRRWNELNAVAGLENFTKRRSSDARPQRRRAR